MTPESADLPPSAEPADPAEPTDANGPEAEPETEPETGPPAPLLELRDGLPPVAADAAAYEAVVAAVRAGSGPVALDAERASGYRYSQRAYLVQLRREGSGSHLVDPATLLDGDGDGDGDGVVDFSALDEAIGDSEWILHAATQDLACLAEIGLRPRLLFDTELAGRLLGYPRVALATLVEEVLGFRLRKEHSAQDWSTRPLPTPWLEYAALDVEPLIELRDALAEQLVADGKQEWARQEFDHLLDFTPTVRVDPWRRTSGMHKVRGRRGLAVVRELWETRDRIAREVDSTPGRIIPDGAIVALASSPPSSRRDMFAVKGFTGRGAGKYSRDWLAAVQRAQELPEEDLPRIATPHDGPPPPRAWADRDPEAAARLTQARAEVKELAEELRLPPENLLTPDSLRRVLWEPPAPREPAELRAAIDAVLAGLGARPWQRELTLDLLVRAVLDASQP